MKRTTSYQYIENQQVQPRNEQVNQLCFDMDSMELRSQTSVAAEESRNSMGMDEMEKILDYPLETQMEIDRNSFSDDIGSLAFSSAIYPNRKSQVIAQPMFAESITIDEVHRSQVSATKLEEHNVSADETQEKAEGILDEVEDMESVSSSLIRSPQNQNKIKITAIQFRAYDEIEASLSLQSNYFRKINGNETMIRTNMKFTRMNGADFVKSRSKCKNPRPSSGNSQDCQYRQS